jgi:hypothetical protein
VRAIITDTGDRMSVEDVVCSDHCSRRLFTLAGLDVVATCRPLSRPDEPGPWESETRIPPRII